MLIDAGCELHVDFESVGDAALKVGPDQLRLDLHESVNLRPGERLLRERISMRVIYLGDQRRQLME